MGKRLATHLWINTEEKLEDLDALHVSVKKSVPYGREQWKEKMILKYHMESTLKNSGRPRSEK